MCGIVGLLALAAQRDGAFPEIDSGVLAAMNASIFHRGPDSSGEHLEPGVGLAMRRLAILDVAGGDQPIPNEDRTIWIVYNGEIYNFESLRTELQARGHRFETRSDTEVIVHAYEEYGDEFVTKLRGMFAFALWDRPRQRLVLARDRVGIKQLFYTQSGGTLAWGSEIKALLHVPGVERRLRPGSVNHFLTYLYVPEPFTMFQGIHELPAGHLLIAEKGELTLRRYWQLRYEPDLNMTLQDAAEGLREQLDEAVRLRMISDVPLGAFLSGGIDSGTVVAMMSRHSTTPVQSFSVGYGTGGDAFDERVFARELAERYSTEHREFEMNPDLIEVAPQVVRAFDQPMADSSAIPNWYLCKYTREHVTVALSGLGGDELAAGYERHRGAMLAERLGPLRGLVHGLLRPFAEALPDPRSGNQWAQRIKRFVRSAGEPFDDRYFEFLAQLTGDARRDILSSDLLAEIELDEPRDHHRALLEETRDADPLNRALYSDMKLYLPGDLLTLTDRMSMAHSLEVRVPFLDHQLLEFAARIPPGYKLRRMERKHILRRAVRELLPDSFFERRKMGFSPPMTVWFRGELRPFVEEALSETAIRAAGVFRYAGVRRLLDDHFARRANYDNQIWALIVFMIWYGDYIASDRGFRDPPPRGAGRPGGGAVSQSLSSTH
jgi:asparagine synthase (glutamine-hydrolysing)